MSTDAPAVPVGGPLARYRAVRGRFYAYRERATTGRMVALAIGFAGLTGVAAQLRVPLPFTPVPITLQTFAVLLAGIVLGAGYGGLSQALYVGLGLAGVPWFRGGGAGIGHLLGPTGGYIVGFVAAAGLVGSVTDRYAGARRLPALLVVLAVADFVVIYGFGLPWLYAWLTLVEGTAVDVGRLLALGLLPFVPGDVVKLLAATAVGRTIAPRTTLGGPER
ncbi:MAG: biotin transporter BioY [Halobacteriales archaeon]